MMAPLWQVISHDYSATREALFACDTSWQFSFELEPAHFDTKFVTAGGPKKKKVSENPLSPAELRNIFLGLARQHGLHPKRVRYWPI